MQFLVASHTTIKVTPVLICYKQLLSFVVREFDIQDPTSVEMNYVDSDGDRIVLDNETDFLNMMDYQKSTMLKVNLSFNNQFQKHQPNFSQNKKQTTSEISQSVFQKRQQPKRKSIFGLKKYQVKRQQSVIEQGIKKGKTLLAMTQIFGDEDSEDYIKFYIENQKLSQQQIIQKWINQKLNLSIVI